MTLPASGPISIGNVKAEFGVYVPFTFSDRHLMRGIAPFIGKSSGVQLSLSEFYGVTKPTHQVSVSLGMTIVDYGTYLEQNLTNWRIGTSRYFLDYIRQGKGATAADRWVKIGFYVESGVCDAVLERAFVESAFDVSRIGDSGGGYISYLADGIYNAREAQFNYTTYVGTLPPQMVSGGKTVQMQWSNFY